MPKRRFMLALFFSNFMFNMKLSAQTTDIDRFFSAVAVDDEATVRQIVRRHWDPNTPHPNGDSALIIALREGSMKTFQWLVGLPEVNINQRNRLRESPLMIAAYKGNGSAVKALLARRAEVNNTGWTALHYAASAGHLDIVQLLLDAHAYVDAESPNKTTPLMMAARGGHVDVVKWLLQEGAVDTLKNEAGMTAEDFAEKAGHRDLAEAFRQRRARSQKPAWLR